MDPRERTPHPSPRPAVEFHVKELVLHGLAPADRYRIGDAVERELARLIAGEPAARLPGARRGPGRWMPGKFGCRPALGAGHRRSGGAGDLRPGVAGVGPRSPSRAERAENMSAFPGSPKLLKGGIVLIDPNTGVVQTVIVLQYNPDTLTRTLQVKSVAAESQNRSEALRLTGPPIETFKLDAEIDATDQLEKADQNPNAVQYGILPQLTALEAIIYPPSSQLLGNNTLAQAGTLEIAPMEAPLSLFVWSPNRVVPMRLTDFSVTEEAFDPSLNPIRAKLSLGMRVLSVDDLGFDDKGGNLYMAYQQQKERMAALAPMGTFGALGIGGIP